MNPPSKIRPRYAHQLYVREHKEASRYRFYLKSRQIGFSFYFALKVFEDMKI